jgi:hypothetical protein
VGQVMTTIPGWVWLPLISVIIIFVMWRMVRTIGLTELLLIGEKQGVNEYARLYVFCAIAGVPIYYIGEIVDHLFR